MTTKNSHARSDNVRRDRGGALGQRQVDARMPLRGRSGERARVPATMDNERYNTLVEPTQCQLINLGAGIDLTIREMAETVADVIGSKGKFVQDTSKPNGKIRKVMDVSKMRLCLC